MQLNRTTLLVDDLEAAKAFYLDAFGFHCQLDEQRPGGQALDRGQPKHHGAWIFTL